MTDALDALANQADSLVPDPAPAQGAGVVSGESIPPAESPNFQGIAFIIAGFRELASAMLSVQSLQTTLADPKVEQCARVLAPVADKYGINLQSIMTGPEAMAAMVAGPILWTAYRELDAELRSRKAKKVETEGQGDKDDATTQAANAG